MQNLEGRWSLLCAQFGITPDCSTFADLIERYKQIERHYHTWRHIENMLEQFDTARKFAYNRDAIELAIWFHDAVYDTHAKDNEEQSANLFIAFAEKIGLAREFMVEVVRLILLTKHDRPATDTDGQIICDIDLSILGYSEVSFDEYEQQIRKEYEWVPEDDFVKGRLKILLSFLGRSQIYQTTFFREKFEEQARRNLTRSAKQLSTRLQP